MGLAQIFAILVRIAEGVGVLLGFAPILQALGLKVDEVAQEHVAYRIEDMATAASDTVRDPVSGNVALKAWITTEANRVIANMTDLGGGGTVTWPTDPPTWYSPPPTPPSGADIASEVWYKGAPVTHINSPTIELYFADVVVETLEALQYTFGIQGVPLPGNPAFSLVAGAAYELRARYLRWDTIGGRTYPPVPDWSAVLADDTPLSFLTRTMPSWGWSTSSPWGGASADVAWASITMVAGYCWMRSNFTTLDLRLVYAATHLPTGSSSAVVPPQPPIWPGLAGVTLGTAVDLADGLTVTGPLDGVLVTVTGTRPGCGKYAFGSTISWTKVGGVLFQSDHGEWEWSQTIGLDAQVIVPQTMKRASAARFRVEQAATGIVQPWTINPPP